MKMLSVILTTYTVEKYIRQAVDSVVNQTYKNLEIIIIDDASIDNTPHILKWYAAKDSRIKLVLLARNRGPGAARNAGISKATGHYITFMDHDDWQASDRYEKMIKQMEKDQTDVCFSFAKEYVTSTGEYRDIHQLIHPSGAIDLNFIEEKKYLYNFPPWAKIYKTELIKSKKIRFAENRVKFDDVLFYSLLLCFINRISVYSRRDYFHRFFEKSISYNCLNDRKVVNADYVESLKQALEKVDSNNSKLIKYYFNILQLNFLKRNDVLYLVKISPIRTCISLVSFRNIRRWFINLKVWKKS